jgi:branched-chain amino acid transport system ATP-binding protein
MLVVRDLDVFYGGIQALRGVSLRVAPGELVTIVGPNGSGKTTLLRAISGLVPVAAGTITFAGTPIAGRPTEEIVRGGIAVVPEGRELWPLLTVGEHLRLGAYPLGRARRRARAAADLERVLSLFAALRPRLAQRAGTLSGGEQQMIAIARALMSSPRLLLLDEPSVGLAPIVIREIFRALGALRAEGLTILLVEQNARAAFRIADHGYALAPGGRMADVAADRRDAADSARRAYGLELVGQEIVT